MKSGVISFGILMLIYLIVAGILLIFGYDITNNRLIVFIALVATISSVIDFLNVLKSKRESELNVINEVYRIKDKIKLMELNLVEKYDLSRNLFQEYLYQVFSEEEINEICKNKISEDKRKLYCEKVSSYEFDDTELKEMIKNFVGLEISPEVEDMAQEGDYTGVYEICKKLQKEINQYERIINIATGIGVFFTLLVMIYFDCLIELFPKIDMDVSVLGFFIIICSVIVREHYDKETEDIKELTHEILEKM